jgi:transcription elongation GreA/GreB family factor
MALALPLTCPQVVSAAPEDEAQAAEVAQMKEEIAALSARLNTLEQQLAAAQAKQEKKERRARPRRARTSSGPA